MTGYTVNNAQRLSLFIEPHEIDGAVEFEVLPGCAGQEIVDGIHVFHFVHDLSRRTTIKVRLLTKHGPQSHIVIKKITLNGVSLDHIDTWSTYVTHDRGLVPGTYGYMSFPGEYTLNIRQNALVQNYITYFLSSSRKKQRDLDG